MANKKRIALMVLLVFILQCVPVAVLAADYDFFPFGFGFGAFEDEETLREDAIENIKEMFDGLNEAIEKINGAVEEINEVIEEEDIFEDEDCDVEAVLENLDKIMRKHFPNINQRRGLVNREDLIDEIETVVERELNALDGKKLDAEEALEDIMAEVTKVVNRELRNYPSRSGGNLAIDNIIAKFQKKNRELMRKLDWLTLFGDNKKIKGRGLGRNIPIGFWF